MAFVGFGNLGLMRWGFSLLASSTGLEYCVLKWITAELECDQKCEAPGLAISRCLYFSLVVSGVWFKKKARSDLRSGTVKASPLWHMVTSVACCNSRH